MSQPQSTSEIRKSLRRQRRRLNRFQQRSAEQACVSQLISRPEFKSAKHIGIYLNAFGEVSTQEMIHQCFKLHKKVYLPRVCPMNQVLHWIQINPQQYHNRRFCRHRLGMREPMQQYRRPVTQLDVLIMPLLACDAVGMRLGMGGGFYDRTLATAPIKPFRVGLAHDFQRLEQRLVAQPWDQALDALLTPRQWYSFKRLSR